MRNPAMSTAGGKSMAGVRNPDDGLIDRDDYAAWMERQLDAPDMRDVICTKGANLYVAAELLDELAAVYKDEPLGRLARELAVKFYDRLGI